MKRLLTSFCLFVLFVAPSAVAQLVPPPDPQPHDCAVDEGACVDEYYFCLNDCPGKNGSYASCYSSYCPDEYNACLYGALHTYTVQTRTETVTPICVSWYPGGDALHGIHDYIYDTTTTYRDQICPDSTLYTTVISEMIDVVVDCYFVTGDRCPPGEPPVTFDHCS